MKYFQCTDDSVTVIWEDGHVSPFDKSWLLSRSFNSSSRQKYRDHIGCAQDLWGSQMMEAGRMPEADYESVMNDDRALLDWLENLDKFGFVLMKNVPVREGPVPALQVYHVPHIIPDHLSCCLGEVRV